jgi:hypothetical protein
MSWVISFLISVFIIIILNLIAFVVIELYKKYGWYIAVSGILEIFIIILIAILVNKLI